MEDSDLPKKRKKKTKKKKEKRKRKRKRKRKKEKRKKKKKKKKKRKKKKKKKKKKKEKRKKKKEKRKKKKEKRMLRAKRALLLRKPVGGQRGAQIGRGGFARVYAVDDQVVCKVVRGKPTSDWLGPVNARRELEIHRLANSVFRKGLTDHVVLLSSARVLRSETRMYLERFDCSLYDLHDRVGPRLDDGMLRSIAMQALHGYDTMRREFGFYSPDFDCTNVLVRVEPDAPEMWKWVVRGHEVTVPAHGVLACIADFGMCYVEGIPRLPDRSSAALPPMAFLDSVAALAAKHGITGTFTRAVGALLAEHVLYKKPHPEAAARTLKPTAVLGRISVPRILTVLAAA